MAILATPTRSCEEYAKKILAMGINTVDSFDIHTSILDYRAALMPVGRLVSVPDISEKYGYGD